MGRRLLPVIVKDVAGLVPGAYKGRGKGNRFLADLCDADVLVCIIEYRITDENNIQILYVYDALSTRSYELYVK